MAAIHLAKLFGAKVATTADSNEKVVNYKHGPW